MKSEKNSCIAYWRALEETIGAQYGPVQAVTPVEDTCMRHPMSVPGYSLNVALVRSRDEVRVELYLGGVEAHERFDALFQKRSEIEAQIGEPLIWEAKQGVQRRKIYFKGVGFRVADTNTWQRQHLWISARLNLLHNVFSRYPS